MPCPHLVIIVTHVCVGLLRGDGMVDFAMINVQGRTSKNVITLELRALELSIYPAHSYKGGSTSDKIVVSTLILSFNRQKLIYLQTEGRYSKLP